ncbi:MAG: hypothetical protein H6767_06050 [Candidatus Peribacteria bacterium]|nr:MAG: hypothetical protein H6767_06050 [Candidatus Peribacteria bacterium]
MSAKASNFDAQISGKVEALVDASLKGQEAFTYELSSFIDFISKDGNLYLLLDKLDVSHNSSDYGIIDFTSAIKKIAKENKYIQFSDAETEEAMSVLKKLNPSLLKEQGNTLFAQPMFTAYKKEGEKYYLKPTKYACDSIKELANIFDPFNGTTCTTGQYNDLLEEYGQLGIEVYLVIGKTQDTLGFSYTDGTVDASGSIVYTDSYIASVDIEVIPDQDRYP